MGAEGYARTLELRAFMLAHPAMNKERFHALRLFINDQIARWIEGDEVPPPLPTSIDEVPEDLRSPELKAAILRNNLNYRIGDGAYSVFDVLTGQAIVDDLNRKHPNHRYEIVGFDSLLEDE